MYLYVWELGLEHNVCSVMAAIICIGCGYVGKYFPMLQFTNEGDSGVIEQRRVRPDGVPNSPVQRWWRCDVRQ